jgi:FkbM family methyltransferase
MNSENINNLILKYGGVISENQIFVDVGSNIGEFSKKIADNFNPSHIYLFEPCSEYLDISKKSLQNFSNISFHNLALGSKKENKKIYKSESNIGWNTLLEIDPKQQPGFYKSMASSVVKVDRLDDCLSDIEGLDFLKIDTEGYEAEVIDGSFNLINKYKPYILVEMSWGINHPNWDRNLKIYEKLFSMGYRRENIFHSDTTDVLFKPVSRKLPISIGLVSWKSVKSLKNTLKSYKENGLFDVCDDFYILFQEASERDLEIIKEYNISHIFHKENIGIGKGFRLLANFAKNKNILLLEHDWELIEKEENVFNRLCSGLSLLNRGFSCVRYRSRKDYGDPLYSRNFYENKELNFFDQTTGLISPHLLDSVHWKDDANLCFPDKIGKFNEYFLSSSRWANYTNNPCLYRKDFYLGFDEKFTGTGIQLEENISRWWAEQNFLVAQGEGLFKHNDIDKNKNYNIVDIFPYFNEKELLELRIKMLDKYVDRFIICEANTTHTGLPKEFSCKDVLKSKDLLSDKITIIETDLSNYKNKDDTWTRERMQRNAAKDYIKENDVCFITDCDEIINPKLIDYYVLVARNNPNNILRIPMVFLNCRADLRVCNKNNEPENWDVSFVCMKHHLKDHSLSEIRESKSLFLNNIKYSDIFILENNKILESGWHFGWMGDNERRLVKYKSFMHYYDFISSLSQKETENFILNHNPKDGSSDNLGREYILRKYPLEFLPREIFENKKIQNFLLPEEINE